MRRRFQPSAQRFLGVARHLFEVVQDHQAGRARGDDGAELLHRVALAQRHLQPLRHRVHDAVHTACRRQVAEPGAARVVAEPAAGMAQREPGLADAADAQQRDQPGAVFEAVRQRLQRIAAADEAVALGRQAVRQLARRHPGLADPDHAIRLGRIPGRHEARSGRADLEQLHGLRHALQAPEAMALQRLRHRPQRLHGRGAEQRLPTRGGGHDTRRQRQCDAVHLEGRGPLRLVGLGVLAQRHLAHVHAHASPQRYVQSGQAAVVVEREAQRIGGALEQQQEAVAAADLAAAPAAHQLARGAIVSRPQRHHDGVTQLVVEPGAVDDIGHQQRKGFAHGRVAVSGCDDTRAGLNRTLTRACRGRAGRTRSGGAKPPTRSVRRR